MARDPDFPDCAGPIVCAIDASKGIVRDMARYEDLPYRTCVGMMLINAAGLVFIGRRAGGIEHVDETHVWQMPQGGVDPGEDTWEAAQARALRGNQRPLGGETRRSPRLADLDIPRTVAGRAWKGRYRGQRQKWYAVRFTGKDAEINVSSPGGGGTRPEFVELALGTDEKFPEPDRSVQAAGL